ncbi:EAL domain-containing protein [Lysinibacillus halotolerans]|uniref:Phosphodiesterase n=1 Tax=Lysinibacillus halotolerans TaxID=1368476 RepID=A0A3M8H704_9BACI|nr:GGDEF domain-containing phosphodiesterase [Lysinibacillus halotolerans]RNC98198.1 phosphodiesterase [Lysinibacillus halotolerans]
MYNTIMPLSKDELLPFLCSISEQYHTGIAIIDLEKNDFPFVYVNSAFSTLTGYHNEELIGKNIRSLNGIKTNSVLEKNLYNQFSKKVPFDQNIIHYHKDGTAFWNNLSYQPIKDSKGTITYAMIHCKDITEQMLSRMLSKLEHEVYIELEENGELKDILQLITEKVERFYIQDIYCAIHVLQQDYQLDAIASGTLPLSIIQSIHHKKISERLHSDQNSIIKDRLTVQDAETKNLLSQYNISTCWSKPIFNHEKKLLGYFSIYIKNNSILRETDMDFLNKLTPIIALSMKYVEQKQDLKRLAYFDISTGIPNFNYFYTNLVNWQQESIVGSILLIQPNEYSSIVDSYGRKFGDELIRQITSRLKSMDGINNEIIFGRFSSSSFILGIKQTNQHLNELISDLLQVTSVPFTIAGREIFITLRIGVSYFDKSLSVDESIRRADIALTNAKNHNVVVSYFEAETDEKIQRELDILNQLRYGLKNEEFTVYLQPKINLATSELEGFEALARWNSPVLGQVSPVEFIRIAEQNGKINEVDNIILKKVLQFQNERLQKGQKIVPIAVNISPVHFYSDTFVNDFISLVNKYNISPDLIQVEVTESVELFDYKKAKEILLELKKLGYESAIDDFGVGFSSLSYLQQLPFSEIKIDRSFINDINDADMHAVVKTIVQLASNLRMHVVAEGIETSEQYAILQKMGCSTGQGFYFHKPMPLEEAEKLLY